MKANVSIDPGDLSDLQVTGNRIDLPGSSLLHGTWQVLCGALGSGLTAYVTAAEARLIVAAWAAVATDLGLREEAERRAEGSQS